MRTLASFILLDKPEFLYYYSLRTSYPLNVRASLNLHLFLTISCQLICVEIYLKMFLGEPCLSAVCSRKQNQFIIYTTQFISVYVKKNVFSAKRWSTAKKKLKLFLLYFWNGYRYHTNFNRFAFQVQRISSEIIIKILWNISPNC